MGSSKSYHDLLTFCHACMDSLKNSTDKFSMTDKPWMYKDHNLKQGTFEITYM